MAERIRRRATELQDELDRAQKVRVWADRTQAVDAVGDLTDRPAGWRDSLVGLAESMAALTADTHTRASVESAEPDELWVVRARRKLETNRRVSGHDRESAWTFLASDRPRSPERHRRQRPGSMVGALRSIPKCSAEARGAARECAGGSAVRGWPGPTSTARWASTRSRWYGGALAWRGSWTASTWRSARAAACT
ncbi:hypothetical protein ACFFX1_21405 [Dactylosporangium sucinum]|uniref:Uncharacterized protein n=1 Tax=Dactylosporangium sucinum TaxID=1424081 RepID=A0A917UHU9_9ACTN|nr:hypothetical protein [Dactylosporangium sucinum]GGM89889.1 hypothetical protein GCM10007977_109940 [Dactylosporangium sucinum]